jgi:hypothetical protein
MEQVDKPHITFEDTRKPGDKGFPKVGRRVLKTWPVNSLWTEFLIAADISDAECTGAAGQVDDFVEKLQRGKIESPMTSFMACVQLWYYGLPKYKV